MSSSSTRLQKTDIIHPSWRITWSKQLALGQVVVLRKNIRNRLSMNPMYSTLPITLSIKQGDANGLYFSGPEAFAKLVMDYLQQTAESFKYPEARFTLEEQTGSPAPEQLGPADLDELLEAAEGEIRAGVQREWSGAYDAQTRKVESLELELKDILQMRDRYATDLSTVREEYGKAETKYKSDIASKNKQLADAMRDLAGATGQAITLQRQLELSMQSAPVSELSIQQYLTAHDDRTKEILDAALRLKEAGVNISHYIGRQMEPAEAALREVYDQCQPLIKGELKDVAAVITASRKELETYSERQRQKTEADRILEKLQRTIDAADADVKNIVEQSLKTQMDSLRTAANPVACDASLCEIARNYDRSVNVHTERARIYKAHRADIDKAITPIPFVTLRTGDGTYHYAPASVCTALGMAPEHCKPLAANLLYIISDKSSETPAIVKKFLETFGFGMLWDVSRLDATVTYGMPVSPVVTANKTEPKA